MDTWFPYVAYFGSTFGVAALLMWGRLEWHAAVLVGLLAPFVGMIMGIAFPIHLFVLKRLHLPLDWLEGISTVVVQTWTLGAAFFLARSLRASGYRQSGDQTTR